MLESQPAEATWKERQLWVNTCPEVPEEGPRQCCCGLIGGNLLSCGVLHQCSSRRAPGGDAVVMPDGLLVDCKDLLRCSL